MTSLSGARERSCGGDWTDYAERPRHGAGGWSPTHLGWRRRVNRGLCRWVLTSYLRASEPPFPQRPGVVELSSGVLVFDEISATRVIFGARCRNAGNGVIRSAVAAPLSGDSPVPPAIHEFFGWSFASCVGNATNEPVKHSVVLASMHRQLKVSDEQAAPNAPRFHHCSPYWAYPGRGRWTRHPRQPRTLPTQKAGNQWPAHCLTRFRK